MSAFMMPSMNQRQPKLGTGGLTMTKKYIDAEMLISELDAACMPIFEKGISGDLGDENSIADIINAQPAADVQEVRHGRWIKGKIMGLFKCSACHNTFDYWVTGYNHCPNCGARMDGEKNDKKGI